MSNLFVSLSVDEAEGLIKKWFYEVLRDEVPQPNDPAIPKYLTRQEVAESLQISLVTLNSYVRDGFLKAKKINNRVLFDPADVKHALQSIPVKFSRR